MRKITLYTIVGLSILWTLQGCATYSTHYAKEELDWQSTYENARTSQKPVHTLYLVGDAGYKPNGERSPSLRWLAELAATDPVEKSVVYLGDNIYPRGMPPGENEKARMEAEASLIEQIEAASEITDDILFIPGNHDWYGEGGVDAVARQEKFIKKKLGKHSYEPEAGCAGPEVIDLTGNTGLIVFDSEWFIRDWDRFTEFNENCDVRSREEFIFELEDALKDHKYKRVIVALHHPPKSNGEHGGHYSAKQHLFPLTVANDNAFLPLPGIGSLLLFIRRSAGLPQDLNETRYLELRKVLSSLGEFYEDIVFVSGHEHNIQYHVDKNDGHHFIVSGAGSKVTPLKGGGEMLFGKGGYGLAKLLIYENGAMGLEFYGEDNRGNGGKLIYAKQLMGPLESTIPPEIQYPKPTALLDTDAIFTKDVQKSKFHNFLFGQDYAPLYNYPFKARVFDLEEEKGGLTPIKRGGGNQTNSLRLEATDGKQYVLRALRKDASRLLPKDFAGSFAVDLVDYLFVSAHPFAATAVPPLAEAIGVYHTNPEVVYLPKQRALGKFNDDHGDKLYLYEQRPDGDWSDHPLFGTSDEIESTGHLLEKMREQYDHRPDQAAVVRARMFDILIGDWDRHDDQWRWAKFDVGDFNYYKPIPRDRDQVFSKYEGMLIGIGKLLSPEAAKFSSYTPKVRQLPYMNFNARYFDRTFMTEADWKIWEREIRTIQLGLNDELIEQAISFWPDTVKSFSALKVSETLKFRRDNLMETGRKFYEILARRVDVAATDNKDYILVKRMENGDTRVRVYDQSKNGGPDELFFDRVFKKVETNEIRIYGLDGDDIFKIVGRGKKGIRLRLVGGADEDIYIDSSRVTGWSKKSVIHDTPKQDEVIKSKETRDRRSWRYHYNTYNRKSFKFNHFLGLPFLTFNPDHGVVIGATASYTHQGYAKDPYAGRHALSLQYSTRTEGFRFSYDGHLVDVIGSLGLKPHLLYQDPFYTYNFFGFGNETEFDRDIDFDFYRTRIEIREFSALLSLPIGSYGSFDFGPEIFQIDVERTEDRLIEEIFPKDYDGFQNKTFAGLSAQLDLKRTNDDINPHTGLAVSMGFRQWLDLEQDYNVTQFNASLSLYTSLDAKRNLVFASRTAYRSTLQDEVLLYQAQFLGDRQGLRGFRNERFSGNRVFHQNIDLRWKFYSLQSYFLPTDIGLFVGADVGRIWFEGESSNQWHSNVGGGLWIYPFNLAVIKTGYFYSSEGGRFTFGIGFDF